MNRYPVSDLLLALAVLGLLLLSGCTSLGSRTISRDSFNYNEAMTQSRNQQLPYLHFAKNTAPQIRALIEELKRILNLDPKFSVFRITRRTTERDNNETTIQSRSLLSIMSFLSRGIDIPEKDQADGRLVNIPPDALKKILERVPLRILSSNTRPKDPYVAVKYRNDWFYIDHSDIRSKRTFATMVVLFNLAAPSLESLY